MIDLSPVRTDQDIDGFLAVRRAIDPEHPVARHAYLEHIAAPGRVDVLARSDGTPVGAAFLEPHDGKLDGSVGYVSVRVLRERRRHGIGTALFAELAAHARAAGWRELYSVARHDDSDTLDYLGKRGFTEALRMQELSLELATAGGVAEQPAGVEVAPLTAEAERAAYSVAQEAYPDLPEEDAWLGAFEEWRADELPSHVLRECSFVALAGGDVVGYATLIDAGEGVGLHGMTAVRRAWRGRGVALALKQAQVASARGAGLRELRTTTAYGNAPMLRVNERLGYRRGVSWIHLRGPLIEGVAP